MKKINTQKTALVTGICILFLLLFNIKQLSAQQLAFPGAEGFGKYTSGGRYGEVYHVTNLNDDGDGSFREAVSKSNRIVVFDVGGVINITDRIVINSNITVAGQTAPGGGITIYGNGIAMNGNSGNNIIRYIRIRMGINGDNGKDALSISDGTNYIFDHVSISWGRDGTLDINGTDIDNITFQDCIISQGINNQNHSTGGLMQSGQWSMIRSLYIDNKTRNPKARGTHEFINSVLYNWDTNGYIMGNTSGTSECNMLGNYFIYGPSSNSGTHFTGSTSSFYIYAKDNWVDTDKDGTLDGTLISDYGSATVMTSAFNYPGVNNLMSAQNALAYVINNVGSSLNRDEVDKLLISQIKSYGTLGSIIDRESDNGINNNVGTVDSGTSPTDSDQDGMPDSWESNNGLNSSSADDDGDTDGDGYTNIEEYLEWIIDNQDAASSTFDAFSTIEAENYSSQSGIRTEDCDEGTLNVAYIEDGDWIGFADVNFGDGATVFTARAASKTSGSTIKIKLDDYESGTTIGTCSITNTGAFQSYVNCSCDITKTSGTHDLYLAFEGGDSYLLNLNYFSFEAEDVETIATLTKHGGGSSTQSIAFGNAISDFYYSWTNASTVTVTGMPDGITTTLDTNEQTVSFTGTPIETGTFAFIITTVGADENATNSGTITVTSSTSKETIIIQENETGFCSIDGTIDNNNSGYSGDGFANTNNENDATINWAINGDAGTYTFIWNYANGSTTDRSAVLYVNETSITTVSFASTNDWDTWTTSSVSVDLESGYKTVRLKANQSYGLANIDYMQLTSANVAAFDCNEENTSSNVASFIKSKTIDKDKSNGDASLQIIAYPNPVSNILHIQGKGVISIYNVFGVKVFEDKSITNNLNIDLSGYSSGMYIIQMKNKQQLYKQTIIKE